MNPTTRPQILIGHGSKSPAHIQAFEAFVHQYRSIQPDRPVHHAYLDYATPKARELKLDELGLQQELTIVPIFLGAASHILEDIPELIQQLKTSYPDRSLYCSKALSLSHELLPGLQSHLLQQLQEQKIDPSETQVLFLGRGSSNTSSTQFVFDLAQNSSPDYAATQACFWDVAQPSLESAIAALKADLSKHIYIQPLFLFPGILLTKLTRKIQPIQEQFPKHQVHLGSPLFQFPHIVDLFYKQSLKADLA